MIFDVLLECILLLPQVLADAAGYPCQSQGLVHPLLGEIHQTVVERMFKGFDANDMDFYSKVSYH